MTQNNTGHHALTTPDTVRRVARVFVVTSQPSAMSSKLPDQFADIPPEQFQDIKDVIKTILEGIYAAIINANPRCPAFNVLVAPFFYEEGAQITFMVFPCVGSIVGGPIDGCHFNYATSLTLDKLLPLFDESSQNKYPTIQWLWTASACPVNLSGVIRVENELIEDGYEIEEMEPDEEDEEYDEEEDDEEEDEEEEIEEFIKFGDSPKSFILDYNYGIKPGDIIVHDKTAVMLFGPNSCYPFLRITGKCKGIDTHICILSEAPYKISVQEKFDWATGTIIPANYKPKQQQQ